MFLLLLLLVLFLFVLLFLGWRRLFLFLFHWLCILYFFDLFSLLKDFFFEKDLFFDILDHLFMLFGFFMISELVFALELFIANFAIKFTFMLLFMLVVVRSGLVADDCGNTVQFILLSVVFFDLAETLLFETLLDMLHLLLFFLLLLFALKSLLLLLLFLLSKTAQIGNETGISFAHVGKEIFDGLHVVLPFSLPLLLVLLLHLATHPSTVGVSGVPLLTPGEGLIG